MCLSALARTAVLQRATRCVHAWRLWEAKVEGRLLSHKE
jgi:hypothetical protein